MFRIKICGLTSAADARAAADAGADAVGINFFPLSPRCISQHAAEEISAALPPHVAKVGVFVNSPVSEIHGLVARLSLDYVQLHGDEPPEFLAEVAQIATIRAFRCGSDLTSTFEYLDRCGELGCLPAAVLIDAHCPRQYGGSGELADWQAVAGARHRLGGLPLVLAGGLKPSNVADAIDRVKPDAVDTASGVEVTPGHKSAQLIGAFVATARGAFARRASESAPAELL